MIPAGRARRLLDFQATSVHLQHPEQADHDRPIATKTGEVKLYAVAGPAA